MYGRDQWRRGRNEDRKERTKKNEDIKKYTKTKNWKGERRERREDMAGKIKRKKLK